LEIKAAQRLETHCAVSQKKVEQAASSGDLTAWLAKIDTEKTAAAATLTQCYAEATEDERVKIQGPLTNVDKTSGINYDYTAAVARYEQDAEAKTKIEQKQIDEVTAEENKKKIPFQDRTRAAQDALADQTVLHDADVVDEKKEKENIQKTKLDGDTDADTRYTKTLGEQEKHLDDQRTSENEAFATTKKGIRDGCTKDIADLTAEGNIIAGVAAKIRMLKVVGREPESTTSTDGGEGTSDNGNAGAGTDSGISLQNGADASDALAKFGEEPQGPPDGKFSPEQQAKYGINADGNVLDSGKLKQATEQA
jgi:hypothetical protein